MSSQRKYKYILGIESSCDDTSAAILRNDVMLSNITAGQEIHRQYGGVVPELASRAHQQHIIPVVEAAIQAAGIGKNEIDAVAFTRGPGLLGSLLVGTSFAKSFAMGLGVPIIEVNHMIGHILAHFIQEEGKEKKCLLSFFMHDGFWRTYTTGSCERFSRNGGDRRNDG